MLCELFQSAPQRGNVPISGNISGFIRRLFLQLMLEDEKVTVFLQSPCPVGTKFLLALISVQLSIPSILNLTITWENVKLTLNQNLGAI